MTTLNPNDMLTQRIERDALAAGVPWDTYHADFLLGVIFQWLEEFDALLTSAGVQKRG